MPKREPRFGDLLSVLHRERTDRSVLFGFFLNARLHRILLGTRYRVETSAMARTRNMIFAL